MRSASFVIFCHSVVIVEVFIEYYSLSLIYSSPNVIIETFVGICMYLLYWRRNELLKE